MLVWSFCVSLHAAVPRSLQIENALRMPLPSRLQEIEKQGIYGRHELQKIAFNKNEVLENRWRALTAYGRIYKRDAQSVMERALRSPEWFMRNAALIVAPYGDREWAIKWARLLIHDSALVVRTAAVQTLRRLNATQSQDLLWEKLYSSENFRSGKSLWIRRHILEALSQFATPGQEARFVNVLNDSDTGLHSIAMSTLERITKEKFETTVQWRQWLAGRKRI